MDTLPLPPRPNLDQYRKRAKDLVSAARSNDKDAVRAWATDWLRALAASLGVELSPFVRNSMDRAVAAIEVRVREQTRAAHEAHGALALADAQFLIAQAHGFENWSSFTNHLRGSAPNDSAFETAADAVVDGDLAALERIIQAHSELIRARSKRVHRASLLHYVAANGVEDFRQRTPPNAVAIARFLLEAGAEVDGLAASYGGDRFQTTMNLLVSSAHPAEAGVQPALVETLIDFRAAVDGLDNDSSPLMTALAFGHRDAAETLAKRGARIDSIVPAAALGRSDLVKRYMIDGVTLEPTVPLVAPAWFRLPRNPVAHIELAFTWACKFGRPDAANLMLDRGVNPAAKDAESMTALHWAAASGLTGVIDRLLARQVPLEVENRWGGTVLNSTLHFALYQPVPGVDYVSIVRKLVEAGANVDVADPFPTGHAGIDAILESRRR